MDKLNTVFNGASAHYNRRTAQNTAETARRTIEIATADRHRDLRARGLIDDRSTPGQIAAVEHRLDAQGRARMELAGELRRTPYRKAFTIALLVAALVFVAGAAVLPPSAVVVWRLLVLAPLVLAPVAAALLERRRDRIVARADWIDGTCGWCGAQNKHIVDGEPEHPRVAHAVEIEREIGGLR